MKIGEAARRSGFSPDTLRYYDKIGLMPRVGRDAGRRRDYVESDIDRLAFIQRAKSVDFSLEDIRILLRLRAAPSAARQEVLHLTQAKLAEIERKLADLAQLKGELTRLTGACCAMGGPSCPILEQLNAGPRPAMRHVRGKQKRTSRVHASGAAPTT